MTCNFGSVPQGGSASVVVTVTPIQPGPVSNTATVDGGAVEVDMTNNSATAGTTVNPAAKTTYVAVCDTGFAPVTAKTSQGNTVQCTGGSSGGATGRRRGPSW